MQVDSDAVNLDVVRKLLEHDALVSQHLDVRVPIADLSEVLLNVGCKVNVAEDSPVLVLVLY
jgi:hypothetical protein